jgi:hypothetical protein
VLTLSSPVTLRGYHCGTAEELAVSVSETFLTSRKTTEPWRWRQCNFPKRRAAVAQRHRISNKCWTFRLRSVSQAVAATCVAAHRVDNERERLGFERGRRGSRCDVLTVQWNVKTSTATRTLHFWIQGHTYIEGLSHVFCGDITFFSLYFSPFIFFTFFLSFFFLSFSKCAL